MTRHKDVKVAIWTEPDGPALHFKLWSPKTDLIKVFSMTWRKETPAEDVAEDIETELSWRTEQFHYEYTHPEECHCPWDERDKKKDEKIGTKKGRSVHPFMGGAARDWEYDEYICHKCGRKYLDAPLIA